MTVNMGPQHPSTHGVLRLVLELDGETVVNVSPTIGFLHTGIEKTAEQKKWQQVIPLVERMDYLGPQSNSLAYCLSVEKLLGIEVPERVKNIRVLIAELQRLSSHLVWFGTHAMEIGAITGMLYAFREREILMNLNELLAGFRFFPSYIRVGGLREDIPRGYKEAVTAFLDRFPGKLDEYETLITKNPIWLDRTRGVGQITLAECYQWGLYGPIARAAGGDYDVRRAFPYSGYETYEFDVIGASNGDVYDRYLVRVAEMRESVKICRQALERITPVGEWAANDKRVVPPPKDQVYTEMEALIQHFLIYSQGFTVPAGDVYVPVEGPRGEHGCYVVSDGSNRPWRVHMRSPGIDGLSGAAQVHRRRDDRGCHRGHRLARRGDGGRGSMSFHPAMPYGTDQWHRSQRAILPEGPEFQFTAETRAAVRGVRGALRARASQVGGAARALPGAGAAGLHLGERRASRRRGHRLHHRGSRGRRLLLRDVPPHAGGHLRAAGVHDAVVRAGRRRTRGRDARADSWASSAARPTPPACSRSCRWSAWAPATRRR